MTTATQSRLVDGDPLNPPGDLEALETSLKEATTTPTDDNNSQPAPKGDGEATRPDWIPEKFWTGNVDESAAKMGEGYNNLQSAYGRMANDLGTQRKFTDQILALNKRDSDLSDGTSEKNPLPKIDSAQLIDDPNGALEGYLKERDSRRDAEVAAHQQQARAVAEEAAFVSKYPDYAKTTATPKFKAWVTSSPLRQQAAANAAQGNYSSADALLTEWEAVTGEPVVKDEEKSDAELEAARKASTESAAQAGGGNTGKAGKIYRRADLIKLRMDKPYTYSDPAFQDEILRAYAEGRVK